MEQPLDGVAIVSAIMASPNPESASRELKRLIAAPFPPVALQANPESTTCVHMELVWRMPDIWKKVVQDKPLSHNMTNTVVQNFAANIALAVGASPIMSMNANEAHDLSLLGGSLVVNMGTVTDESLKSYCQAAQAYNLQGGPIVLDPVGAGATQVRRSAVKTLMSSAYFDVIKGNESEILTIFDLDTDDYQTNMRGVDSSTSTRPTYHKAEIVQKLALREKNVVVMTGKLDIISDGHRTYTLANGHEYLASVTGAGCVLGTVISAMLAVERTDKLLATMAGLLMFELAAEHAARRADVHGPGSFVPALIDKLHAFAKLAAEDGDVQEILRFTEMDSVF